MELIINGETREIPEQTSATQLIQLLGLEGKRLAIEANMEIIPRSTFDTHFFKPGDKIEIVQAIGGG
jgi:thiamine biosynthesis protein ThiS